MSSTIISYAFDWTVYFVYGAISLVTDVTYVLIELSCFLGYLIVGNGLMIFNAIYQIFSGLVRLIVVLFEDYSVFVSDVCIVLTSIVNGVHQCVESFYSVILYFVCSLISCISDIGSFVINIVTSVFKVFYHFTTSLITLYLLVKKTCLLVGLSVWNAVTGVPDFLLALVSFCSEKISEGFSLLLSCIHNGFKSVLEFPVRPMCGLSIAILLGLIVLKKRYSIWHIAYRTWLISTTRSQQLLLSGWQSFEGYVLWLLTNQTRDRLRVHFGDRPNESIDDSSSDDSESSHSSNDSDRTIQGKTLRRRKASRVNERCSEELDVRLCVVCQDKTRCIVTLPCRHVCLCNTCCTAVRQHQGLCPLCRQEIAYASRVYL